jgi:hypothetical protein
VRKGREEREGIGRGGKGREGRVGREGRCRKKGAY